MVMAAKTANTNNVQVQHLLPVFMDFLSFIKGFCGDIELQARFLIR
jgi:hypothetical protein